MPREKPDLFVLGSSHEHGWFLHRICKKFKKLAADNVRGLKNPKPLQSSIINYIQVEIVSNKKECKNYYDLFLG